MSPFAIELRRLTIAVLLAVTLTMLTTARWASADEPYSFASKWGTEGPNTGQFMRPFGAAVDRYGNVYVADKGNNRIQKFTSRGTFLLEWGGEGTGDGRFRDPTGVAVGAAGEVVVTDTGNNRVQVFTLTGGFVRKWGIHGRGLGEFFIPLGIAVDPDGNVYVADHGNRRMQKFTSTGEFLTQWTTMPVDQPESVGPRGVAADQFGVYVAVTTGRIRKFSHDGSPISAWGDGYFSASGDALAADGKGNVFAFGGPHMIRKYTSDGTFLTEWGGTGSGDGQFGHPRGLAVDRYGNVFAADEANARIQMFTPQPGSTALVTPDSRATDRAPTFSWNVVENATDYLLVVKPDPGIDPEVRRWYSREEAACERICSVKLETPLRGIFYSWWVGTRNSAGFGRWSEPKQFFVPLPMPYRPPQR